LELPAVVFAASSQDPSLHPTFPLPGKNKKEGSTLDSTLWDARNGAYRMEEALPRKRRIIY
jgi:hypothetical protein